MRCPHPEECNYAQNRENRLGPLSGFGKYMGKTYPCKFMAMIGKQLREDGECDLYLLQGAPICHMLAQRLHTECEMHLTHKQKHSCRMECGRRLDYQPGDEVILLHFLQSDLVHPVGRVMKKIDHFPGRECYEVQILARKLEEDEGLMIPPPLTPLPITRLPYVCPDEVDSGIMDFFWHEIMPTQCALQ